VSTAKVSDGNLKRREGFHESNSTNFVMPVVEAREHELRSSFQLISVPLIIQNENNLS
jgi:hypothetical protein